MNIKDNFDRLREADNWLLPNDETSAPTRKSQHRKRSLTVLGTAVAVAAVAAIPVTVSRHGDDSANPSPSSLDGAVPWKALAATSPSASVDPAASVSACSPKGLGIRVRPGVNPAMGTMYVMVDITNSGTGDCTMRDSDLTGLRWGKDHHPTAPVAALDQAVVIPGGTSQEYRLGFPSSCSTSPDGTATTPTEATIGGQNVSVTSGGIPASLAGCDATEVSAVGASNGSDEAVSPFADLHADMDVAHTVAAGLLSYTITLTNNGTEALNLAARCPSYTQRITFPGSGPVDERYRLNCEAASELAPGASVTFAMQVTIPDTAITAGEIKLLWLMDDDGPDAGELLNAPTSAQ